MAYNAKGAWSSKRLVFRGMVWPEDEGFLIDKMNDAHSQAMSYPGLLLPPSKTSLESCKKWYESCLLAVIVCIRNETPKPRPTDTGKPGSVEAWMSQQRSNLTEIGCISLSGPPSFGPHHRNTSIGINLVEEYRGKGYGPEAINWAADWAFRHAGMHRVSIGAFAFNEKACKLYESMGFVPEGRIRDGVWHNGGWHDVVDFGMLEDEWRKREQLQKEGARIPD